MRKLAKGILGIILLCLLGGTISLFLLWSRMPDIIASNLSKRLEVDVEIGDMKLSPHALKVEQFVIHNPIGFKLPKAFSAQKIEIQAPLAHYFYNHIQIDQIIVSNIYIGLEFDSPQSTRGNWSTLLTNAQNAQEESKKWASDKTILIKRLLLTNIRAELLYQTDGKIRRLKSIPQIELTDISSEGGDVGDQLLNSALGEAVKQIFIKENLKDLLDRVMKPVVPEQFKNYLGPLKNFFNYRIPVDSEESIAKVV